MYDDWSWSDALLNCLVVTISDGANYVTKEENGAGYVLVIREKTTTEIVYVILPEDQQKYIDRLKLQNRNTGLILTELV